MGPADKDKYIHMRQGMNTWEKPIWSAGDRTTHPALRETVATDLGAAYSKVKDKDKSFGMIDFVKDDKAGPFLKKAAGYLEVKVQKYSNPKLEAVHNPNVGKCLDHIVAVLKELNLPLPNKL